MEIIFLTYPHKNQAILRKDPETLLEITANAGMSDEDATRFLIINSQIPLPGDTESSSNRITGYDIETRTDLQTTSNDDVLLYRTDSEGNKIFAGGADRNGNTIKTEPSTQKIEISQESSSQRKEQPTESSIDKMSNIIAHTMAKSMLSYEIATGETITNEHINNIRDNANLKVILEIKEIKNDIQKIADQLIKQGYSKEESLALVKLNQGKSFAKALANKLEGSMSPEKIAEITDAFTTNWNENNLTQEELQLAKNLQTQIKANTLDISQNIIGNHTISQQVTDGEQSIIISQSISPSGLVDSSNTALNNGYSNCNIPRKAAREAIDVAKSSNIGMAVDVDESSQHTTYHVKDIPEIQCTPPRG